MKFNLTALILVFCFSNLAAQDCPPEALRVDTIRAIATDLSIDLEGNRHHVYVNTDCTPNQKLLLHMVGTIDNPARTTFYPTLAANNGYKVISLKYKNDDSASELCRFSQDENCYVAFHQEIIYGIDAHPELSVDESNSIYNRLVKLLLYMHDEYPSEGWDDFLIDNETVDWTSIVLSGHSQGGGHAAFIAKENQVDRVVMFASPNEFSFVFNEPTAWLGEESATPDSCFYAFLNLNDEIVDFDEQYACLSSMNLNSWGDSLHVQEITCPFDSTRILYTKYTTSGILGPNHNSVVIDFFTPLDSEIPVFLPVWTYLLGLCPISNSVENLLGEKTNIQLYPNPAVDKLYYDSTEEIRELVLFSQDGRFLKRIEPNSSQFSIETNDYHGYLFARFLTKDNERALFKVFVE